MQITNTSRMYSVYVYVCWYMYGLGLCLCEYVYLTSLIWSNKSEANIYFGFAEHVSSQGEWGQIIHNDNNRKRSICVGVEHELLLSTIGFL